MPFPSNSTAHNALRTKTSDGSSVLLSELAGQKGQLSDGILQFEGLVINTPVFQIKIALTFLQEFVDPGLKNGTLHLQTDRSGLPGAGFSKVPLTCRAR